MITVKKVGQRTDGSFWALLTKEVDDLFLVSALIGTKKLLQVDTEVNLPSNIDKNLDWK